MPSLCTVNYELCTVVDGEVAERLKAHAWKACLGKPNVGSNPTLSAMFSKELEIGKCKVKISNFQSSISNVFQESRS